MTERIQKLLATAGVASRRAIEEMIAAGRITVNGRPAEVGQRVGHEDHVRVDGRLVALSRKAGPTRVLLFRKKTGELVTRDDPDGRRTVFRKLPELETGRWIAVGRLDINTSGLLLMTNHGELARRLTHPSFEVERIYAVRVLGEVTEEIRQRLLRGVTLDDGEARAESIRSADPPDAEDAEGAANRWYEVRMREGRNRIVRRLFESQQLQVSRLIRIAYGPVQLGRGIKAGSYREATPDELNALLAAVGMQPAAPAASGRAPARRDGAARTAKPASRPRRDSRDARDASDVREARARKPDRKSHHPSDRTSDRNTDPQRGVRDETRVASRDARARKPDDRAAPGARHRPSRVRSADVAEPAFAPRRENARPQRAVDAPRRDERPRKPGQDAPRPARATRGAQPAKAEFKPRREGGRNKPGSATPRKPERSGAPKRPRR